MATDITMHIMHILQQYIRGHITGVDNSRWKQHVVVDVKFILNITILFFIPFTIRYL